MFVRQYFTAFTMKFTQSFDLNIKALDDEQRIVEGWATRPEVDRTGDIVIPTGAEYKLPLPFLLDHDHEKAVGEVEQVFVSDAGIRFIARIKRINSDSNVARSCTNAWELIKNGLRRYVSIGFRVLDYEDNPKARGMIVKRWEWLELSAVTIPALGSAEITGFKRYEGMRGKGIPLVQVDPCTAQVRNGAVKLLSSETPAASDALPLVSLESANLEK